MAKALILTGYGINCDIETQQAFEQAGAETERVHLADLVAGDRALKDYDILAVPGGFSFGDDLGSGRVLAARLRHDLGDQLQQFIDAEKLVIGICNGFQVLVNLGLLPGLGEPFEVQSALTFNKSGRFEDRWVNLAINPDSPCVFTKELHQLYLPVRHGEGRFVTATPGILKKLHSNGQIVATYQSPDGGKPSYPANPNGSIDNIAGICDPTGRIFGLMPHPEAAVNPTNHPRWTREAVEPISRQVFANAVAHVDRTRVAA